MPKGNNEQRELRIDRLKQFEIDHPPMAVPQEPGIGVALALDKDNTTFAEHLLELIQIAGKDDAGKWTIRTGKECCEPLPVEKREDTILNEVAVVATLFPRNDYGFVSSPGAAQEARVHLRNEPELIKVLEVAGDLGVSVNLATFDDAMQVTAMSLHQALGQERAQKIGIYSDLPGNVNGEHKNRSLTAIMEDQGITKPERVIFTDDDPRNIDRAKKAHFPRSIPADPKVKEPVHWKEVMVNMLEATQELVKEHRENIKKDKTVVKDAKSFLGTLEKEIKKIKATSNPSAAVLSVDSQTLAGKMTAALRNSLQAASQNRKDGITKPATDFRHVEIPTSAEIRRVVRDNVMPQAGVASVASQGMDHKMKRVANSFKKNAGVQKLSAQEVVTAQSMDRYIDTPDEAIYRELVHNGGGARVPDPAPISAMQADYKQQQPPAAGTHKRWNKAEQTRGVMNQESDISYGWGYMGEVADAGRDAKTSKDNLPPQASMNQESDISYGWGYMGEVADAGRDAKTSKDNLPPQQVSKSISGENPGKPLVHSALKRVDTIYPGNAPGGAKAATLVSHPPAPPLSKAASTDNLANVPPPPAHGRAKAATHVSTHPLAPPLSQATSTDNLANVPPPPAHGRAKAATHVSTHPLAPPLSQAASTDNLVNVPPPPAHGRAKTTPLYVNAPYSGALSKAASTDKLANPGEPVLRGAKGPVAEPRFQKGNPPVSPAPAQGSHTATAQVPTGPVPSPRSPKEQLPGATAPVAKPADELKMFTQTQVESRRAAQPSSQQQSPSNVKELMKKFNVPVEPKAPVLRAKR